MRIISCHVENFGKLKDVLINFESDGITRFCRGNGWGKSTLAAFIKVMFYGFPRKNSKDILANERLRYQPWQGGTYGGQLTFQIGKKCYEVTRIFGGKPSQDVFQLVDVATHLPSNDFSEKLGEEIFQVDAESFVRSAFFTQKDCQTHTTDQINAKIGALGEVTDDIDQYERGNKRMTDYLNQNSPTRKTGKLFKKKEEMLEMRQEILELERQIQDSGRAQEKAGSDQLLLNQQYELLCQSEQQKVVAKENCRSYFPSEIPAEEELEEMIRLAQEISGKKKMAEFCAREASLESSPTPEKVQKNRSFLVAGCIFLFLGFLGFGIHFYVARVGLGLGVFLLILWFLQRSKKGEASEKAENPKEYYEEALADYVESVKTVGGYLNRLGVTPTENLVEQLYQCREKRREYFQCEQEIKQVQAQKERFQSMEYNRQQEEYYKRRARLEERKNQWNNLQAEWQEEEKKWKLISIAQEMLEEAKNQYLAKYAAPIKTGFDKYYKLLNGGENKAFQVDAKMELMVKEEGAYREIRAMSEGLQDLAGICMRMAFLDAMYSEEKPLLLLDDPFVNLDDEKFACVEQFLQEIAKEYQVIYFTCHRSRA